MNKIVKFHNDLNSIKFSSFRAVEYDLFFAILYKLKDKQEEEIILTFEELKKLSEYKKTQNKYFIDSLIEINQNLLSIKLNFKNYTEGLYIGATFFTYYEINEQEKTLSISVNRKLTYLINDLTKNFTQLELKKMSQMSSKYSKIIFRFLKQYDNTKNNTNFWEIEINEFKELLNIPSSYLMANIDTRILKPALSELSPLFYNLKLIKKKRGRKIDRLRFEWNTETVEMKKKNENEQKKSEVESKRKYRIVENTPKVKGKEKSFSEQIKEELEAEQEALNRSTTLLGAYIAGLKDVTNNSIIIDSKRRINLRKEKIEKLEQFSNLADDEIDESLEKVIQKVLKIEIK
nr:replication initiation protein [uncultured Leptotrichia sp.]